MLFRPVDRVQVVNGAEGHPQEELPRHVPREVATCLVVYQS